MLRFAIAFVTAKAKNVGIGTDAPVYKLDLAGRMRLEHSTAGTAGIWFDGPTLFQLSFVETLITPL